MGSEQDKDCQSKLPSEDESPLSRMYGKLPHGGSMLRKQPKERTYFDSGDFATSAAHRMTDNGAIQTGKAHPNRNSISRPFAPIPAGSNVGKDANEDIYRKSANPEMSRLHQQTNMDDGDRNEEEQVDSASHKH